MINLWSEIKDKLALEDIRRGVPHVAKRYRTTTHATNGKRECERRMRQIAKGQLKKENGLVP